MKKPYGKAVGSGIDFSGKCVAATETKADIAAYVKSKMEIVDDFCVGKNKLKARERKELENAMLAIKSTRGVDLYFRTFIDSRI